MSLVENDTGVALKQWVGHCLAQQHPVGHVLEDGFRASHVLETDTVADFLTQLDIQLFGDTLGYLLGEGLSDGQKEQCQATGWYRHGSNSAWLCAGNHTLAPGNASLKHHGRYLRGLPGSCLTNQHQSLVFLHHVKKLVALLPNWQLLAHSENCLVAL